MDRIITKSQRQNMPSIDRLSGLSDDILIHILSFLPTKLSMKTSILAKRWRFLWAHAPSLRFEREIPSLDVIHRIMALQKSKNNMDTFSLSDMPHCNKKQLKTLIITVFDHRNVRRLHLCRVKVVLPQCLFTSKTLVDLRLDKCVGNLSVGSPTCLPSLQRLYLHGLTYLVEDALPRLLSGCPVLEELSIINPTLDPNLGCLRVSSSSLKKLEIVGVTGPYYYRNLRVVINAPALVYLKVHTGDIEQLSLSSMTSLIEAEMRLYSRTLSPWSLFASFPNLKCLKLLGSAWKFSEVSGSAVKLDCLTKLELCFFVAWDELLKFLEIADKLEVLITQQVRMRSNQGDLMDPKKGCLLHSLKTIRMRFFDFTEEELCVLQYVLRNAIVLKRVDIYSGILWDLPAKYDVVKRILLFDRGSTECKVACLPWSIHR